MTILKKTGYGCFTFLQLLLMAGMWYLQDLANKRAGVNHHLYYRRAQFNAKVLTGPVLLAGTILLALLLLLVILFMIRNLREDSTFTRSTRILSAAWIFVTIGSLHLQVLRDLYVSHYLIGCLLCCSLLSLINIKLTKR